MSKESKVFMRQAPAYSDRKSGLFVDTDLFQKQEFPLEYPANIHVHQEYPAMPVPLHWHPGPELIYSRNKEIKVMIDGKKDIVCPGEFILISSYAVHAVEPKQDGVHQDVMSISFQAGYLERMMPDMCRYTISRDAPGATDKARDDLKTLCEKLRSQLGERGQSEFFGINQLLFAVLQTIFRDFLVGSQDKDVRRMKMKNSMAEILTFVEKNYREPLTTKSVADRFGYTREYFCRMFKNYSDQTFKKYLTDVRLREAVKELAISDCSIGAIAMNHGFPDEKSFFDVFKKTYQMTPAQFRRHQIK